MSQLSDALREGYQVYKQTSVGYTVRIRTKDGWTEKEIQLQTLTLKEEDL